MRIYCTQSDNHSRGRGIRDQNYIPIWLKKVHLKDKTNLDLAGLVCKMLPYSNIFKLLDKTIDWPKFSHYLPKFSHFIPKYLHYVPKFFIIDQNFNLNFSRHKAIKYQHFEFFKSSAFGLGFEQIQNFGLWYQGFGT